jgi:hypothetical protein
MLIFTGRCKKVGSNSKRREIIPGCSSSQGDAGRLDRIAARGERSYLDAHVPGEMQTWTRLDRITMTKAVPSSIRSRRLLVDAHHHRI